ncbi:MAG: alcohol dehydrogenase catalytic domain-containing protein [Polyangiaceae bacterium]
MSLTEQQSPCASSDECVIDVMIAGICRTDLLVARGALNAREPITLGHEFSGLVSSCPSDRTLIGSRVAVRPQIECQQCTGCRETGLCLSPHMLGIVRDGCFAEKVVVPTRHVLRIPDSMTFRTAAYVEPVAAALAVIDVTGALLDRHQPGLIYGKNRIAELTRRVLEAHGYEHVCVHDPSRETLPAHHFAWAIETVASTRALSDIVEALRPRGVLVLKSRTAEPMALDLPRIIRKEISFHAVSYGSFERAIDLLAARQIEIDDLIGDDFSLDEYELAFAKAYASESSKVMLRIGKVD